MYNKTQGNKRLIGVIGAKGRLGSELLKYKGDSMITLQCDLSNEESIRVALGSRPDVVINCGAITDVDGCEDNVTFDKAIKVNGRGPGILRSLYDGYIIHLSTDYIFDGRRGPYDEKSFPSPVNRYGWTKLMGEQAVLNISPERKTLVIRTTVLFDGTDDFVSRILNQLRISEDSIRVTNTLKGSPTYVPHLSKGIMAAVEGGCDGILNIAGTRVLSRYEFARQIADAFGFDQKRILPFREGVSSGAERPKNAGLKLGKAKKLEIPLFDPIVGLAEIKENENIMGTVGAG